MMQRILVPLDGNDFGEAILGEVEELAAGGKAEVVLFRVGQLPQVLEEDGWVAYVDQQMAWAKSDMTDYLEKLERRLKARGLQVQSAISFGEPAAEILRYAEEKGITLIAMTTHARTGLEALWRGSVARRVYQGAKVPVLLKRLSEKEVALQAA